MMTWLSYLACSAAMQCYVTLPTDQPYVGLAACQVAGELGIAQREENHKGLHVQKVRCTIGKKPERTDNAAVQVGPDVERV